MIFKWSLILLGCLGLYGAFMFFNLFQGQAFPIWGHAISWSFLVVGVFCLVASLKVKT